MWKHLKNVWGGIKDTKISVKNKFIYMTLYCLDRDSGMWSTLYCIGNIREWFHKIQVLWNVMCFEWGGGGSRTIIVYFLLVLS